MLEARKLRKTYSDRIVVEDISIFVERGQIVGLLGQNGAGKTTCFDMIVGLVKPDAGEISINNKIINNLPIHKRASYGLSYLTQENSAFRKLSVEENIKLFWEMQGIKNSLQNELLEDLLEEFEILHLKKSKAISLSGGERRRLEIARALAQNPDYLLLDEPFSGVDPIATKELQVIIKKIVQTRNLGVLLTDHNPKATLFITDYAYIIGEGRVIAEGTPEEIKHNKIAKKYYLGDSLS